MAAPELSDNPTRGITLKLISVCFFSAMAICIKAASSEVPAGEAVFFRSFFAIPVIIFWLASTGHLRDGFRTNNLKGHLWRGVIGSTAMILGFSALALLPLPEVTAIGFAAPIITVVLAAMFLGERIRLYRVAAVMVGLLGVLIIVAPRLSLGTGEVLAAGATLGAIAALGSAFARALALVFTRKLVVAEHTATIVFYFSTIASIFGLATLPFGWVVPSFNASALLIASGLLGGLGQMLLTSSYRYAPAGVIAPFDYAAMVAALLAGYFLFDEIPTPLMLGGAALVIASGIFIVLRERSLGLKRGKARAVTPTQG